MFFKKSLMVLTLLMMTQLSFAGVGPCMTIASGNWSDAAIWSCGSVPIQNSPVTIKSGHTVTLDVDTAGIGSLVVEAGGDFAVAASASGLSLNASSSVVSGSIDLSEASIELLGDLTINAQQLDIKLGSVLGAFALTLNSAGETRFTGIIGNPALSAISTDVGGTTVFDIPGGGLNTPNFVVDGPRIFNDNVLLVRTTHIKGIGGQISFNGTVDTDASANFTSLFFSFINNTTLQFNNNIGISKNLGAIEIINSNGAIIELNLAQISVRGKIGLSGSIVLNSPTENVLIENTSAATNRPVGLGSNLGATIRTAQGANPNSLSISSPLNKVKILAPVGDNNQPLKNLTINTNNKITLNTPSITTPGVQSFTGDIIIGQNISLNADEINIQNNLDNAGFDVSINNSSLLNPSSISGILSGAGDLNKNGAGDLGFTVQTSMTGNVFLNQGSLSNNSAVGNLFVSSPVITLATGTVANLGIGANNDVDLLNGQILQGGGLCQCTLNVMGGVVSPGLSSGQITNQLSVDSMIMNNQSTLDIQLNGSTAGVDYDQVIVDDASLTDGILNLSLDFTPALGETFTIIRVNLPAAVMGTFAGLSEGAEFTVNNTKFKINYNSSFNVVLTVIGFSRYYVDVDAVSGGNGTTWETAFNDLHDALNIVGAGDEVWVAKGVYYPDSSGANPFATFTLNSGVQLYGGFNGTETDLSEQNPVANLTIISGDIDGSDNVDANGVTASYIDLVGFNSYHLFTASGTDLSTLIDGFTLTAGWAQGVNAIDQVGSVIQCSNNSFLNLNNLIVQGNKSNDRNAIRDCTTEITHSSFINNNAVDVGAVSSASGSYTDVLFQGNVSNSQGSLFYMDGGFIDLTRVKIIANGNGSSTIIRALGVTLNFNDVLISGNRVEKGVLDATGSTSGILNNLTVVGNLNPNGGDNGINAGIRSFIAPSNTLEINNSIFWNNQDSSGLGNIDASVANLGTGTVTINSSLVQGAGGSSAWIPTTLTDLGGNLDEDPLLVMTTDPSSAPTTAGDTHLTDLSMAIDTGDNSVVTSTNDLDGNIRFFNTTVDMGAYEYFDEEVFKDGFE